MRTKLLGLVLAVATTLTMSAQEHFTFKGVELNGPLSDFITQMEAKGFVFKNNFENGNGASMTGSFMGYSDCELYIFTTPNSKMVRMVKIYLPEEENSWSSLKSYYTQSVDAFTKKYGAPGDEYSFFSKPYYEGDGYEMTGVKVDKCNYAAFWELEKGAIFIEISKWCQVCISYEDNLNTQLSSQEKEQNILDEI